MRWPAGPWRPAAERSSSPMTTICAPQCNVSARVASRSPGWCNAWVPDRSNHRAGRDRGAVRAWPPPGAGPAPPRQAARRAAPITGPAPRVALGPPLAQHRPAPPRAPGRPPAHHQPAHHPSLRPRRPRRKRSGLPGGPAGGRRASAAIPGARLADGIAARPAEPPPLPRAAWSLAESNLRPPARRSRAAVNPGACASRWRWDRNPRASRRRRPRTPAARRGLGCAANPFARPAGSPGPRAAGPCPPARP